MHPQACFVKFALNDRQHRVLQDMERSRLIETTGKQARGQWWRRLARWAPARAGQSAVRTDAGSKRAQSRYVGSSKPQEQCC